MLNQRLAVDALAQRARARDRLMCLDAGGVNDIKRHARLIGEHDGAIGGFAFDIRRA